MVYVIKGGSLPCPDGLVHGLHLVDPLLHQPPESVYPIQINFDKDLRNRARERWEETLSWVQYWWEAGYTSQSPMLFYGRNLRMDSPMVLFVLYHINKVLPEGKPIRLEAVLAWRSMLTTDGGNGNKRPLQLQQRRVTRRLCHHQPSLHACCLRRRPSP